VRAGLKNGQFNHQETVPFWRSFIRAPPLTKKTASLIGKETDERRTSNIERPTSNNEFRQFY
jgi:hypothetical protein